MRDTGPLIHLHELSCLDPLNDFQSVLVPERVWREVERHRLRALKIARAEIRWVPAVLSDDARLQALVRALVPDLGEQAALSVMVLHPDAILPTDDVAARLAVRGLGYRVDGSGGILLRSIGQEQRSRDVMLALLRDLAVRSALHAAPSCWRRSSIKSNTG